MNNEGFGSNASNGFIGIGAAMRQQEACGSKHESTDPQAPKEIGSDDLISFSFSNNTISASCELKDDGLHVLASGGDPSARNGTRFKLDYISCTNFLLDKLNSIIKQYSLAANNGYYCHVDGLPGGCGDSIDAVYASGERLHMYSNQSPTVSFDASDAICDAFHDDALKNGFDFNTAGSNVQIYDDADRQYLQGIWKGRHFGSEITAIFTGNTVKIFVDGNMTDNTEYTVFEGFVRPNRLKNGISKAKSKSDYEEFEGCSSFAKSNSFTLTAYFTKSSYSTCNLLRQKK